MDGGTKELSSLTFRQNGSKIRLACICLGDLVRYSILLVRLTCSGSVLFFYRYVRIIALLLPSVITPLYIHTDQRTTRRVCQRNTT